MVYDFTCIISGLPNETSCKDILQVYFEEIWYHVQKTNPGRLKNGQPTRDVHKAFSLCTDEDEENRRQAVLIGPLNEEGNVRQDIPADPKAAMPLIRTLHDVVPAGSHTTQFVSTRDQRVYNVDDEHPALVFVTASALRILSLAAPQLTPARLWALKIIRNGPNGLQRPIAGVEYGPINFQYMYVSLCNIGHEPEVDAWMIDFMMGGVVENEHRREMMMGMGKQWVLVRPDRFPVAEALAHRYEIPRISNPPEPSSKLSSLPIDILLEICSYLAAPCLLAFTTLSRSMLSALRPFMDHLVRAYILRNEPWLLPPDDGGAGGDTMHTAEKLNRNALTWVAYLKACRESASMKNRARIWGISRKLAELADELGIAHL